MPVRNGTGQAILIIIPKNLSGEMEKKPGEMGEMSELFVVTRSPFSSPFPLVNSL
jgi:hypothetical protein